MDNQPFAPRGFAKIVDDDWLVNENQEEDTETTVIQQQPAVVAEEEEKVRQPARINPDSRGSLWMALILVFMLMLSSFVVSFTGIWDISQYTGLPVAIQWVPAVFIDAAILAYTISLFVFKARGESTWRTIAWLLVFAGISVAANISHTLDYLQQSGVTDWRVFIGIAITASAPVAVLAASEEISRLAFQIRKKK